MYTKANRIFSSKMDLSNYVEGFDVYNSKLLYKLLDPELEREYYEITVYQYRPDLIARDYYGSDTYMGLVIAQNGLGLENYKKGTVIQLIKKSSLDNLVSSL